MTAFFMILHEQNAPEDKLQTRLIEIAIHYTETRDALAALAPDDPEATQLARQAKEALDAGWLGRADALLGQAKDAKLAAWRKPDFQAGV